MTVHTLTIHGRQITARGNLDLIVAPGRVLITGSRASTPYGETIASSAAENLARRGAILIASTAYGIDGTAVRAARPDRTVLIQAAGLDKPYPRGNAHLAREIQDQGGLIISVAPDTEAAPTRWNLLDAAALRGAIAHHAIFVEGTERSSIYRAALTCQARWAVPGPLTSATSALPHKLLREGARLWTDDPADADLITAATNTSHPYRSEHAHLLNHRAHAA
jgi:predicted Rossmann fold nucleotide-binding protein DprA/Smf involved in DNA uptake